jgi:hypothetical protein
MCLGGRVVVTTQVRVCRIGACSTSIPPSLARNGVCLGHYLDEVFTRVSAVQARCEHGELPDARTLAWLGQQGDLAVRLLSGEGPDGSEDRTRLLELLLCLANLHESLRQPAGVKAGKPKPRVRETQLK